MFLQRTLPRDRSSSFSAFATFARGDSGPRLLCRLPSRRAHSSNDDIVSLKSLATAMIDRLLNCAV